MSASRLRTLGLVLLAVGVVVIALARFSAWLPGYGVWLGLALVVLAWLAIGLSFRAPRSSDP